MQSPDPSRPRSIILYEGVLTGLALMLVGAFVFRQNGVFFTTLVSTVVLTLMLYRRRRRTHDKRLVQALQEERSARWHAEALVAAQHDLARITSTASTDGAAWQGCLAVALRVAGMDSGGLYLFAADQTLELVAHQGLSDAFVQATARYPADAPNVQLVLRGQASYFDSDALKEMAPIQAEGLHSVAVIPIHDRGQILGCLNLASTTLSVVPAPARRALEHTAAEIGNLVVLLRTRAALDAHAQQLRAEQLRFAKVVATVPGAICSFRLNPEGVLSVPYASPAFEELYGLSPAAVAETIAPLTARVVPEELPSLVAAVTDSAHTLQPWHQEYRYQHPTRGEIWLEGFSMPVREEDGSTVWHGFTTDVTIRKHAELAHEHARTQLAAIAAIEHALAASLDEETIITQLAQGIGQLFPDSGALFIARFDAEHALIEAAYACADGEMADVATLPAIPLAPAGQGTQSQVIHTRQPLIINNNLTKQFRPGPQVRVGTPERDTQAALYVPMLAQEQVLGVIQLQSYTPNRFGEADAQLLSLVANTAAVALQNARLYDLARRELAERRQTESALRASENRFATIFHASPVAMVITRLHDNQLEAVNTTWLAMLGYTRAEVIGFTPFQLGIWVNPQDRRHLLAILHARRQVTDFETILRHKAGAELHVLLSAELTELNGEPHILMQIIDITERIQAEEQLRQREVRFRALIEHAPGAICLLGAGGTLTFVSASTTRVMGYQPEALIGRDPATFTHPDDLPALLEILMVLMATPGQVRQAIYRMRHHDGTWRWVESTISNLLHEPSVGALAFNFQDITERKQAELALRASEERYRVLMKSLDSVVATVDAQGIFHYLNDVAAQQLGGSPPDFTKKHIAELFPEPVASAQLAHIRQVIATDQALTNEARSMVQGEWRWYRTTIQPIHDEADQVVLALINATDIHDLKTTQQELLALNQTLEERVRERTAEVQDLYDHAPTGYHSLDAEGQIVLINQTELAWLGYRREELIGRRFTEVMTEPGRLLFQQAFPEFKQRGWLRDMAFELIRKDGTTFPILVNATAIYDERGTFVMSRSTVFDNTERKKAEAALRESEAQNRLLFEAVPDAVVLFDDAGRVVRFNPAFVQLTGYAGEELTGRSLAALGLITDAQIMALGTAVAHHLATRPDFAAAEFPLTQAGGATRHIGARIFGLTIAGQHHYLTTLRDITTEKQAEETLRQANAELARAAQAKDEFLANMSHELRTPLNAILTVSESLLEGVRGPLNERQQRAITTIEASGRYLLALITDILDLAKVEAGRLELQRDMVPVADVCRASLVFVKELALKKAIQLVFAPPEPPLTVEADPRKLKQMLVNLLSNAVKFTPAGGAVRLAVAADAEAGLIHFLVEDTGIGIAPDDLGRLFQPFTQLDARLSRQHDGTGLGLALVKRLAELHGGSVAVASTPGQGSRFTISLPYQGRATAAAPPSAGASARPVIVTPSPPSRDGAEEETAQMHILLAEDNPANREATVDYLEAKGYRVIIAQNGYEAIARAEAEQPAVILMDIQMPELDGLAAIRRLRTGTACATTPIIAVTALAMPGDRERCLAAGANAYLTKPVSLRELVETITRLIETTPPRHS